VGANHGAASGQNVLGVARPGSHRNLDAQLPAASPNSDGDYGKTKVAPKVKVSPVKLGQVKLLLSPFERAMKVNQKCLLDLDAKCFEDSGGEGLEISTDSPVDGKRKRILKLILYRHK